MHGFRQNRVNELGNLQEMYTLCGVVPKLAIAIDGSEDVFCIDSKPVKVCSITYDRILLNKLNSFYLITTTRVEIIVFHC